MRKERGNRDGSSRLDHRVGPGRRAAAPARSDAPDRIRAAGLRLFSTLGFDATGTKRIAEDAGVPVALIFYYFKTKEDLLESILSQHSLVEAVTKAFTSDSFTERSTRQEPLEMLTAASLELIKWLGTHRQWAMLFFRELTMDRPTSNRLRQERTVALELLGKWLTDLSSSGPLPISDAQSAAQMLASGLLVGALVDRPRNVADFAKRASATILRSMPKN